MKKDEVTAGFEEKLGHAMVKGRLITDVQLKTALEYQRSLGGTLTEVITKLSFVRPAALSRFLAEANMSSPPAGSAPESPRVASEKWPAKTGSAQRAPQDDDSEHPTQRPLPMEASARRALDPALLALVQVLVRKGVIGIDDREQILNAGSTERDRVESR